MARGRWQGRPGAGGEEMWLIAPYLRLSREDQRREGDRRPGDDSDSIANQQAIADEFIAAYFGDVPHKVVDYFKDDGLTGTDDARQDFMRLIEYIEQGKVNCVVVKTLARAFRNYADQGYYLEQYFPRKKVRFICIGSPRIDTYHDPDAVTGYEVPISGIMNDRFASQTSHQVRQVLDAKRRSGQYIGAFAPYGFLKDPHDKHHLIPDEKIAALKRQVLGWVIGEGMTWMGVARKLNGLGVPNPTAYKRLNGLKYKNPHAVRNDGLWCGTTVKKMMLAPVNLGHMVQGRQRVISYKVHDREAVPESQWYRVDNTHQPVFTQEEYDTLRRVTMRDARAPNGSPTVHLLSGLMRCADCDKAMLRKSAKGRAYYYCRTYDKSKAHCEKRAIREDMVKEAVLTAIQRQIALLGGLSHLAGQLEQCPTLGARGRAAQMLEDKKKEADKARALSDGLYPDWKAGVITYDEYRRMKAKCAQQIQSIEKAMARLEGEREGEVARLAAKGDALNALLARGNVPDLDRALLLALVDVIHVTKDKGVIIQFRFGDQLMRMIGGE